jgi:hypothetical protein
MFQTVIKYTSIFHCKTLQNLSNLDFWFENKPSGNHGRGSDLRRQFLTWVRPYIRVNLWSKFWHLDVNTLANELTTHTYLENIYFIGEHSLTCANFTQWVNVSPYGRVDKMTNCILSKLAVTRNIYNETKNLGKAFKFETVNFVRKPCRRGAVDIASASRTRRPGFESRQGIRFLGKHSYAVVYKWLNMHCLCVERKKGIGHKKFVRKIKKKIDIL